MASLTTTGAHALTARKDIHEVARDLTEGLGPTLVAALAGSKDRKLPSKWAKPDGPEPRAEFQRRLLLAHRVWTSIENADGAHVARQWFIGGNPSLKEATPITAIREDLDAAVVRAAEVFITGLPDE